ncbi:MAG: ABC transporter permease [Cyclobacteriaceae bacterium]|nr:ABC transporter permease [Cyclobacteriaceae bacterium]
MLFSYIRIAYRNLVKTRVYSGVNIFGLAVGISSVLLIALYLMFELSFDKHFVDGDRIYRVALERLYPDRTMLFGSSPAPMASALQDHFEQVESATRFHRLFFGNDVPVTIGDVTYNETLFRFADENFFSVFSYEFIQGNPKSALAEPANVVITESIARKYFNTTDALNKTFKVDTTELVVSGVIKDLPPSTHMKFDLLGSIHQVPQVESATENNSWTTYWVFTYVKLKMGTDASSFENQLPSLVEKFGKGSIAANLGANYKEEGHAFNYFLQPLQDIHLRSNLAVELGPNNEIKYVYMLALVAVIVLIISTINFVNLSTARATERAKEVGIRKVMGSFRSALIGQFLSESIIVTIVSAIVAMIIVWIVLPTFNTLLGLPLSLSAFLSAWMIAAIVAFVLVVGVMAGLYPASVISGLRPAAVLKGKFQSSKRGMVVRNGLIGLQFFISITMISGAILVHEQMDFFSSKDLGFQKSNVGFVRVTQLFDTSWEALRNDLLSVDGVEEVAGNFGMPGEFIGSSVVSVADNPDVADIRVNNANFDDYFFDLMDFEIVEGRAFKEEFNDSLSLIVNESMARLMGDGPTIGKKIIYDTGDATPYTVVGVVKDYHFQSLHNSISPLAIANAPTIDYTPATVAFRFRGDNMQETLEGVERVWKTHTSQDFSVKFLDDSLMSFYKADMATGKLFDIFTAVAIVMSCIGLFGLATYMLNQRLKEMGVRKVLGASLSHIVLKFSQTFVTLIAISFLTAIPITWYLVQQWLDGFAYSIEIGASAFVISAIITVSLVVLTISYQALKLAWLNPVITLKDD